MGLVNLKFVRMERIARCVLVLLLAYSTISIAQVQTAKSIQAQINDIRALAAAEQRQLTPTENRELNNLRRQLNNAQNRIDMRSPPAGRSAPQKDVVAKTKTSTSEQRIEMATSIGQALGIVDIMLPMSAQAENLALELLESSDAPKADRWRKQLTHNLGVGRVSIYTGQYMKLEDLQEVGEWLDSLPGQIISGAVQGWQTRMPTEPQQLSIEAIRKEQYAAIAASAIWAKTLTHINSYHAFLPVSVNQYSMTDEQFADLWSRGAGYTERESVPVLAEQVIPYVFADVDDDTLAQYIDFQNTPAAERVFEQISSASVGISMRLLDEVRHLLQRHMPEQQDSPLSNISAADVSREEAMILAREALADNNARRYLAALENLQFLDNAEGGSAEQYVLMGRLSYRLGLKRGFRELVRNIYDSELLLQAETYLDKSVKVDPQSWDGHTYLGFVAMQQGNLGKAARHLETVVAADEQSEWLMFNMADLRSLQKRNSDAVRYRLRAIQEATSFIVQNNALESLFFIDSNDSNHQEVLAEIDGYFDGTKPASHKVWYGEFLLKFGHNPDRIIELLESLPNLRQDSAQLLAKAFLATAAHSHADVKGFPDAKGSALVEKAIGLWPEPVALVNGLLVSPHYGNAVPLLLHSGHGLNTAASSHNNPISLLAYHGDFAAIENAIDAGLDVNMPGSWSALCPIHIAAYEQKPRVIEKLLALGADPTLTNSDGQDALSFMLTAPRKPEFDESERVLKAAVN